MLKRNWYLFNLWHSHKSAKKISAQGNLKSDLGRVVVVVVLNGSIKLKEMNTQIDLDFVILTIDLYISCIKFGSKMLEI